jgi:hypothetical protein
MCTFQISTNNVQVTIDHFEAFVPKHTLEGENIAAIS